MKTQDMTFGEALTGIQNGPYRMCRAGWNGKGMWIELFSRSLFYIGYFEPGEKFDHRKHSLEAPFDDLKFGQESIEHLGVLEGDDFYPLQDFLLMKTAQNTVLPWVTSQADVLAVDWMLIPNS